MVQPSPLFKHVLWPPPTDNRSTCLILNVHDTVVSFLMFALGTEFTLMTPSLVFRVKGRKIKEAIISDRLRHILVD